MSAKRRASLPMRVLRAGALLAVAGLLALLVWRVVHQGAGGRLVAGIQAHSNPAAPAFDLAVIWPHAETWPRSLRAALADGRVSMGELHGYPLVLNFWASWCIPCRAEAPRLAASARAHAGSVAFLGIDVQDLSSDARRFLGKNRVDYVSARDGGGSTYDGYGLTGVPETYYVDSRGRIIDHYAGEVSRRQLEAGIAEATQRSRR